MAIHVDFLRAIQEKKVVKVEINSFEKGLIKRTCIPFDFGPSNRYKDGIDRYHFYDVDSPDGAHNLAILAAQLLVLEVTNQDFNPGTYVTWKPPYKWYVKRDWAQFS